MQQVCRKESFSNNKIVGNIELPLGKKFMFTFQKSTWWKLSHEEEHAFKFFISILFIQGKSWKAHTKVVKTKFDTIKNSYQQ